MSLFDVVPVSGWTLAALLAGAVLTAFGWRRLATGAGWRPAPTAAVLLGLTGVIALTLTPADRAGQAGGHGCALQGWASLADALLDVGNNLEHLLNLVLVVPLGVALVMAIRQPLLPLVTVLVLPGLVELSQIIIPGRVCSLSDYLLNALGGVIGVGMSMAVTRSTPLAGAGRQR